MFRGALCRAGFTYRRNRKEEHPKGVVLTLRAYGTVSFQKKQFLETYGTHDFQSTIFSKEMPIPSGCLNSETYGTVGIKS